MDLLIALNGELDAEVTLKQRLPKKIHDAIQQFHGEAVAHLMSNPAVAEAVVYDGCAQMPCVCRTSAKRAVVGEAFITPDAIHLWLEYGAVQ